MLNQEAKTLSVVNLSVLDQKAGLAKEVKPLEEDGNAKQLNIKTNTMEKGHYGQYTGNARHSRKEDEKYDANKAYDKNLSASARLHYLENNIADHKSPASMLGDLDKDGSMSEYETKRQNAINKNTKK